MIPRKTWLQFFAFSFLAVVVWFCFTYPQLTFINLSIDRPRAVEIARRFMIRDRGISPADLASYQHAAIFVGSSNSDRYLQKAVGFRRELEFLREHDYELFLWSVRFFKEDQKEEYYLTLSAATGEVTDFSHVIDESVSRPDQTEEQAQARAVAFLKKQFQFDPEQYLLHDNIVRKHERRTDYIFSWEKKGVFVRWNDEAEGGGAQLLTSVQVSGEEILSFHKIILDIPDQFHRYLERIQNVGRNFALLFRIIFYALLTTAIFHVVVRRNNLVMHTTKRFCVGLTAGLFLIHISSYFNQYESIIYHYPTTSSMMSYLWRNVIALIMDTFIVTISILIPCLAGESLRFEVLPQQKHGSFLHYIRSTFLSREVGERIFLGYLAAVIMIGIQSLAFEVGQRHLGVWVEYTWMAQLSAGYLPFLQAFIIGASAGFSEEISFRLFGISLGKKFLKNTAVAVLLASLVWGYGHSTYMVFPMWFRGLEVTLLGIFLSCVYLRWGILSTITAHYLFDVFWETSAYLLGKATLCHFYSSISMLLLPMLLGIIAFVMNKQVAERPMRWQLTRHQLFNLEILGAFLKNKKFPPGQSLEDLKNEIASHGWDAAVVEIALEEFQKNKE